MNDYGSFRPAHGEGVEDTVICPKPLRVVTMAFSSTEIFKPVRHRRSLPQTGLDHDPGHEILEIILSKNSCCGSPNFGCSPPYFTGSPPSRAGNPVVRDAEFSHERCPSPVALPQPKPKPAVPSFRASPSVRVEGFDCSGRGFECTGRDTRCQVPAYA